MDTPVHEFYNKNEVNKEHTCISIISSLSLFISFSLSLFPSYISRRLGLFNDLKTNWEKGREKGRRIHACNRGLAENFLDANATVILSLSPHPPLSLSGSLHHPTVLSVTVPCDSRDSPHLHKAISERVLSSASDWSQS